MIFYVGDGGVEFDRYAYALAEPLEKCSTVSELFGNSEYGKEVQIVIIGSELSLVDALAIADRLRIDNPTNKVVLSRKRLDVEILAKAMRAGITEVVLSEDSATLIEGIQRVRELINALPSSNQRNSRSESKGKVIVVFSAKGGCGKTTVSVNLANAISDFPDVRVCLVDLDLQFGDIAVSLQQQPEKTISSAITMGNQIDLLGTRSIITKYSESLDLLLAPTNPTDVEYISGELVEKILDNLKNDYDFVVIDTPPAFTDFVLKCLEMVDSCFLVMTLDMPAIKNLKVVLDTLESLKIDKDRLHIVLNRADADTGISIQEAEALLEAKIEYFLPNEKNISVGTNRGEPIIRYSKKSSFSKEIVRMAKETLRLFRTFPELQNQKKRSFTISKRSNR